MMIFLLLTPLFFSLQLVHAELTLQVPNLTQGAEAPTRSLPLTALNYLDPLTDGNRNIRPYSWPQQLTFSEPLNLTADEVQKILVGERKRVYHCGGKPVEAGLLASLDRYDGHINTSSNFEFKNNQVIRKQFPPGALNSSRPTVDNTCDSHLTRTQNTTNQYDLEFHNCSTVKWNPVRESIKRINETGELVFEWFDLNISEDKCPSGEPIKTLLVPSNSMLVSGLYN